MPAARRERDVVLGIDLGTTNSVVAVVQDGDAEVLVNDVGNRLTPSCVHVPGSDRQVGEAALRMAVSDPEHTVRNVKRVLGLPADAVTKDPSRPLGVVRVRNASEGVGAVLALGERLPLAAEEVAATILVELKKAAEAHLGRAVSKAVISVPTYFNAAQRHAVRDAGSLAGLEVLRLVNEPTAAAMAYAHDREFNKTIVVVDVGGGGSSISVLRVDHDKISVLASSGQRLPGGEDFDNLMVEHLKQVVLDEHGKSVQEARSLELLRAHWEKAKQKLSRIPATKISTFLPDVDLEFQYEARRGDLEQCRQLFDRIVGALLEVLHMAKVQHEDVDDVLLVGGSTRVHRLRELVQEALGDVRLCKAVHQDEDVAKGAALLGAGCFHVKDVTALHLNVMYSGVVIPIAANTQLPYKDCKIQAKDAEVMVRQGHWVNQGAEEMPLAAVIEVTSRKARISFAGIRLDESGLFEFLDTGGSPVQVVPRGCLSGQKVAELRGRNHEREREQEGERCRMEAKNALEDKCRTLLAMQVADDDPDAEDVSYLKQACQERLDWLQGNPDMTLEDVDRDLKRVTQLETCLSDGRAARALDAREREEEWRRAQEGEARKVAARTALEKKCREVVATQVRHDDPDAAAIAALQQRCGHVLLWLQNNLGETLEEFDRKKAEIDQDVSDLHDKRREPARARRGTEMRPRTASSASQPRDGRQAKGTGAGTSSVSKRDGCQGDGEPTSTNVSVEAAGAADQRQAQVFLEETYKRVFVAAELRRMSFTPPLSPDSAKGPTSRWLQEHPDETLRALAQDVAQQALAEARRAGAAVLLVDEVQCCVALSVRYVRGEAARVPVERLLTLRDAFTTAGGDLLRHLDELSAGEDPAALTRAFLGVSWEDDLGPVSAAASDLLARLQARARAGAGQHADGGPGPVRLWVGGHSLEMRLANECAREHPEAGAFFEHVHTVRELFFGAGGAGFELLRRHCPAVRREDCASVRGLVRELASPGGAEGVSKALVELRTQCRRHRAAVDELLDVLQDPTFLACACIFDQSFSSFRNVERFLVLATPESSHPAVLEQFSADLKARAWEDVKLRFQSRREFSKLATRLSETARAAVEQCIRETATPTWVRLAVASGQDADDALLQSVPRELRLGVLGDLARARKRGLSATDPWALLRALPGSRFRADFPALDKALVELLTAPLLPCRAPGGAQARSVDLLREGMLAASHCPDALREPVMLLLSSTDWSGVYDREKDFCPLLKAIVPIVQR